MALKGNLKDFSINNILQMIFLEKKGGRLLVTSGKESISVFFDEGKILHAEQGGIIDKRRMKRVLLKNQYLTKEQWDLMVEESERTFQPLWILLSRFLEKNTHAFLFLHQRHIEHVLFSLLRWERGEYEYNPEDVPHLDKKVFRPVEGEFLLMEGYRVIDELKKLESKLPPMETKIFTSTEYNKIVTENDIRVDDNERYILSILEQPISLNDLFDSSQINICETGKGVEKLLSSGILTVLSKGEVPKLSDKSTHNWRKHAVVGSIFFSVFLGILVRTKYLDTEFASNQLVNRYKIIQVTDTMNNIVKSLKFYISLTGTFPYNLESLVKEGYISRKETLDPWGREFILEKNSQFFAIFSQGLSPDDPGDDIYFHLDNQFYHE